MYKGVLIEVPNSKPHSTRSGMRWAVALDAVGVGLFALGILLLSNRGSKPSGEGFWADAGYAALMLTAVVAILSAGVVALVSVIRDPLVTRSGRWALRLTLVAAVALPLMGIVEGFSRVIGHRLPVGWGEPLMPFLMALIVATTVLGVTAKEDGRRGVLVLPMMLAAVLATFIMGDIVLPE